MKHEIDLSKYNLYTDLTLERIENNNKYEASMKNSIKKVEKAVASKNKEEAQAALKSAIKNIDKAVKNGVTSKNTCARNKSRLTKKVNEME